MNKFRENEKVKQSRKEKKGKEIMKKKEPKV